MVVSEARSPPGSVRKQTGRMSERFLPIDFLVGGGNMTSYSRSSLKWEMSSSLAFLESSLRDAFPVTGHFVQLRNGF